MHQDFYAPFSCASEKTPAELETDRQRVLNDILAVYRKVGDIGERNIESFKRNFDMMWKSKYASNPNRSSNLKAGLQLPEEFFGTGIIDHSAGPGNRRTRNSITLAENNVAGTVNMHALHTQETALSFANVRLEKTEKTANEYQTVLQ